MTSAAKAVRAPQARSALMRRRILDVAITTLTEEGYGGTTTLEVQRRAGISRGALLHHFGSRSELMLAALDHLMQERLAGFDGLAPDEAPTGGRIDWAVRSLWSTFEGPLFAASLELWLAARSDAELRAALVPHERAMGRRIRALGDALFASEARSDDALGVALEILLDAMRGAASRSVLRSVESDERMIAGWVALMTRWLSDPDSGA